MGIWTPRDGRAYGYGHIEDYCVAGRHVGYVRSGNTGISSDAIEALGDRLINEVSLSQAAAKKLVEGLSATEVSVALPLCPHPDGHDPYTIEVRSERVGRSSEESYPSITIYRVQLRNDHFGLWTDTLATEGELMAFLNAVRGVLAMLGYAHALSIDWPADATDDLSLRWELARDDSYKCEVIEDVVAAT